MLDYKVLILRELETVQNFVSLIDKNQITS